MVEEIRTYLLNSKKFSESVYFPSEYTEIVLPSVFSQLRDALLGDSHNDSMSLKAWKANFLVSAIYRDQLLAPIANELFDPRVVPNKALTPTELDPVVTLSSVQSNLLVSTGDLWGAFDGVNKRKIVLTRTPGSPPHHSLDVTVSSEGSYEKSTMNFTFSGQLSDLRTIPGTPIKIAFTNCTSIPDSLVELTITVEYPNSIDINAIINRVGQIPEVETLITSNEVSSSALSSVYHTVTRGHQRLLCLLMAYACSLKNK